MKAPRVWQHWAAFGAFGLAAMWHGVARTVLSGGAFLGAGAVFVALDLLRDASKTRKP